MGAVVESKRRKLSHPRLKSALGGALQVVRIGESGVPGRDRGAGRAAPASADYVALGDSYAAGPLIPLQLKPYGCLKSSNNYAHLAAPKLASRRSGTSAARAPRPRT